MSRPGSDKLLLLFFSEYTKVIEAPSGLLEMDALCAGLPLTDFTWTRLGRFPEALNLPLLEVLRTRVSQRTMAGHGGGGAGGGAGRQASVASLLNGVQPNDVTDNTNTETTTLAPDDLFYPPRVHVKDPLPFVRGNGVPEVLGIAKINALLRRTQQEQTHCLIAGEFTPSITTTLLG